MKHLALLLLLLLPIEADADIYTLGSSFTWDGIPGALDDSPQWHIGCGFTLLFIYENPYIQCVAGSPWLPTLAGTSFDSISFQPVEGTNSTLAKDLFTILLWLQNQPTAKVVIHQTWPIPSEWEAMLHDSTNQGVTNRSLAYGYTLMQWVAGFSPGREVVLTRSNEMLDRIYHDCAAGACPLPGGFGDLFRDSSGHMRNGVGVYLTHNALRAAFGQPVGINPEPQFQLTPEVKTYLDDVVAQFVPEPGADLSLLAGSALIGMLARRRRVERGRDPD